MSTGSKSVTILRILLFFLIFIVFLTIGTFFWIRTTEEEKISEGLNFLKYKDRNLEMMERSFEQLYEADNDFRLYTLTYDPAYSREYEDDIHALMATLDSLRVGLEDSPAEMAFVENAGRSLMQKEDLSERFIRIKRLADSLLHISASFGSVRKGGSPKTTYSVRRYYPDLAAMGMDTLNITTVSERERVKKGVSVEDVSQVIAGQTNLYYQNQLRLQRSYREQMEAQEKALILTNKVLMEDLKEILNHLDREVDRRNTEVHQNAVSAIDRSARIINYTSMISLGIVLVLLLLIVVTIGRIIRYQKQLHAARVKAERDAAEKTRFLAYMSHELRTPLTSIVGFTEQLKETPLNSVQERYLSSMSASAAMLLTTVNDVLDLSKLEAGKMRFFITPFNPASVAEQVLNSLRPLATVKGLTISMINSMGDKTVLSGDEMRLKQVLINLLNNAVKYTEQGEITLTLSMKPCRGKQCLDLQIADTGIGIPPGHLKEIFSEFSQVHEQSGKKWIIGTGLGLPICKKIVEQQGGRIWAESQPGKGSVFHVLIPYHLSKKSSEEVAAPGQQIDPSIFTGKRILIVDDTEINLLLLEAIFEKWGVKADKARNGAEALAMVKEHPYNLILSDVNMPEMGGIEMTRQIRREGSPERSKIPVIILTANILQDEIGKFQQAGVSDFIMKPFLMNDLYQVIRKNMM